MQFLHSEWFHQIVINPGIQGMDPFVNAIPCREHQDGSGVVGFAQTGADFHAAEIRKAPIKDGEIHLLLSQMQQGFLAVVEPCAVKVRTAHFIQKELQQFRVVIDDQQPALLVVHGLRSLGSK